jgi:hypothetical protein
MTEWTVVCVGDLVGVRSSRNKRSTYLNRSGKAHNPGHISQPILFVLCRLAHGPGVNLEVKILVQMFTEDVHILLLESLIPFLYEFDLRGV